MKRYPSKMAIRATIRFTGCVLLLLSCAAGICGEPWRRHTIDQSSQGADGVRLADVNGDGLLDIATGWEQGGLVRAYLHPGHAKVRQQWPAVTVGRVRDLEDAVFVDLDADGAVDVVSCAEGQGRAVSVHWAPRGEREYLRADGWQTQSLPAAEGKQMWMFAMPLDVDGSRGVDLVAGGKNKDAALGWFQAPVDARNLAEWKWRELRKVGWLMSLLASDMDGDGDLDIVFTDRKGARTGAYWLEHPGPGLADRQLWREHAIGCEGKQAMFMTLADLDGDELEDALVAVQPKELLWLRRRDESGRSWTEHSIAAPEPTGIMKAVSVGDIDLDGKQDLVFTCEQAKPPAQGLMWLSCGGDPLQGKWQANTLSGRDGVKHDLAPLVDLDGDGDLDVLTTEEVRNLGVIWYENPTR